MGKRKTDSWSGDPKKRRMGAKTTLVYTAGVELKAEGKPRSSRNLAKKTKLRMATVIERARKIRRTKTDTKKQGKKDKIRTEGRKIDPATIIAWARYLAMDIKTNGQSRPETLLLRANILIELISELPAHADLKQLVIPTGILKNKANKA